MPGKVLVADDSLRIQKELTQLLQEAGIEVVTVSNGEHAVRKLLSVQPNLVLADLFMPVRSGYEVCEYIKNNPELAHIGVLLLASRLEPFDEKEAQRVRADGKLEKPLADPAATLSTIKEHLEKAVAQAARSSREELAVAPPSRPESAPEPEPEPEPFSFRPPPVTFEEQAAPMGFTDIIEEETRSDVDLSQDTLLTHVKDLEQQLQEPSLAPADTPGKEEEAVPGAEILPADEPSPATPVGFEAPPPAAPAEEEEVVPGAEILPAEEPAPAAPAGFEPWPPLSPPAEETPRVETPEVLPAWEMTGPEPGAPEIPAGAGWESQWSAGEQETIPPPEAPPAEEAPLETQEAPPAPTPAEEEVAPAVPEEEAAPAPPYTLEELAPPFAAIPPLPVAEEIEEAPATEVTETVPAPVPAPEGAPEEPVAAPAINPAVVDEVVKRVLERLSPQVMESFAREIVRPLAENLLKENPKD
ncbi:MAG: PleD family two-component system response regulator [Terriglobia bacterium]